MNPTMVSGAAGSSSTSMTAADFLRLRERATGNSKRSGCSDLATRHLDVYAMPRHIHALIPEGVRCHFVTIASVFTLQLHVMQRTVFIWEFCPSVRLFVERVHCDITK